MFYLYEHWRTDKNVPFYVGKGNDKRIKSVVRDNPHHKNICALLERTGHKVIQKIIFATEIEQEVLDAEVVNIAACREAGIELCNKTDGGEGVFGYEYTEEQKLGRKIRAKEKYNNPDFTWFKDALKEGARSYQLNKWNGPEGDKNRAKQSELSRVYQEVKWSSPEAEIYRKKASQNGKKAILKLINSPNWDLEKKARSKRMMGKNNPKAKINEATAQAILDFEGSKKDAARIYNCNVRIVSDIKNRETWRHLTPSCKKIDEAL